MRALSSSTNSRLQLLSSIPTSLQQGWALRPTAEDPCSHHRQWGGGVFKNRVPGHRETNGPGYVVFGNRGRPHLLSLFFSLKKKSQSPLKTRCLKDFWPCRAFLYYHSTPHADQGHSQCCWLAVYLESPIRLEME